MSLYSKRGVSAQKEEVHSATKQLDQGLFPHAFCKIYPDYLANDDAFVNVMHADGAGTKSILAYLYWKETGDISVWKGIAQDAIVMNLDDLLCVGIYDNIVFNSTIDRNKNLIPGAVLEQIINGSQQLFDELKKFGVNIHYLGGETADVGDVVRTIAVNGTMTCRWPKNKIISNEKIKAGDVIVGFASYGQASYEQEYNSGIGSNGLTSARHDVLSKFYADNFKESYDNSLADEVVYIGKHRMSDYYRTESNKGQKPVSFGQLLLSPTRTYAPVLKLLLETHFDKIHGLIHCSGGGQTKCMKYLPAPSDLRSDGDISHLKILPAPSDPRSDGGISHLKILPAPSDPRSDGGISHLKILPAPSDPRSDGSISHLKIIKDNLFDAPEVFRIIQENSGSSNKEMYEVFNMGCRLEIYCDPSDAGIMINAAKEFNIDAQVIGRVEAAAKKELVIKLKNEEIIY